MSKLYFWKLVPRHRPQIIDRGFEMFKNNEIQLNCTLEEARLDQWCFVVGSQREHQRGYLVKVDFSTLKWDCDCPYDSACKHLIASLIYLYVKTGEPVISQPFIRKHFNEKTVIGKMCHLPFRVDEKPEEDEDDMDPYLYLQKKTQEIEEAVTCSICIDQFKKPVSLNCLHFFCRQCIWEYRRRTNDINCPLCRQESCGTLRPSSSVLRQLDILNGLARRLSKKKNNNHNSLDSSVKPSPHMN